MKIKIIFVSLLLTVLSDSASSINDTETKIVNRINLQIPQSLKNLEELVNINSGTMNLKGVKKVGQHLKHQLDEIGFTTKWIEGSAFQRAGHLFASHGNKGVKILLIGHLDTVFTKEDSFQQFQVIDDNHIAGPGITDMKGGNIIIVSAVRALKQAGLLDNVSIRIIMTGDEEKSGRPLSESKKVLIEAAQWADVALGFEDGDGDIKTAVISRRGSVGWQLQVKGKAAHSSQVFSENVGYGAIYEAARILNEFRVQLRRSEYLTFNPGVILGGTTTSYNSDSSSGTAFGKGNVVSGSVKVSGDIRALSVEQLSQTKKVMQLIVEKNLAHTSAELTFTEGYPPMGPTKGNRQLLAMYSRISQELGFGKIVAVNPLKAGAADISFAAEHVKMSLDGLGLMGSGGHTKKEKADISSLSKNTQKAALLIYRLSRQPI